MGKSKKSGLATQGKKKKVAVEAVLSSTESEGEDSGSGNGRPGGKGGRNGTIRHVYTTNSDMECIEEYLKPVYKDGEVILEVECGSNKAMMYLSKLCQGSKGPCVQFQGSWLTPNEFQYVSGRETAKDWKRSIRHQGKSMKLLLTKGVLSVHSTVCDCDGCRLTSPVVSLFPCLLRKHLILICEQLRRYGAWLSLFIGLSNYHKILIIVSH